MIIQATRYGTAAKEEPFAFTYSGTYALDGHVLRLLTSGVLTFNKEVVCDIFLVGGGGGGGKGNYYKASSSGNAVYNGGGGGGGGYTLTKTSVSIPAKSACDAVIGAGGNPASDGGDTSILTFTAAGGKAGLNAIAAFGGNGAGGAGGSGGGGGGGIYYDKEDGEYDSRYGLGAAGGSDGANSTTNGVVVGGTGQRTTTRAFGETSGELFSTGGRGNPPSASSSSVSMTGASASDNTGNGGDGGVDSGYSGGSGGSGIILIRLPEGALSA